MKEIMLSRGSPGDYPGPLRTDATCRTSCEASADLKVTLQASRPRLFKDGVVRGREDRKHDRQVASLGRYVRTTPASA